jgi:hypothetical protein
MHLPGIEWVSLANGRVIVASSERSWVTAARGPFAAPMTGPGSVPTTGHLLDGAARTGWAAAPRASFVTMGPQAAPNPGAQRAPQPPLTVARWAHRLCGFYRTTNATPRLMREAAERFARAGRGALMEWALTKAREEQGHDTLVLRDLSALGYDAEAVALAIVPEGPAALVQYFERCALSEDPIGAVGYAYALERLALEVDEGYIAAVEASLPRGVMATRCLRVHSAAGSDRKHVQETVELVATLSARERAQVAIACHETATICYGAAPLEQETLERQLSPFEHSGEQDHGRSKSVRKQLPVDAGAGHQLHEQ